jgi:predicted nucleotide-binding protein
MEVPIILRRRQTDGIKVIPVIMKKCDWHYAFGLIEVLPHNRKPISDWKIRGDAYMEVSDGVKQAAFQFEQAPEFSAPPKATNVNTGGTQPVPQPTGKTLIIHGHAGQNRLELVDFLQNKLGLPRPTVIGDEMTLGLALPVKFDKLASTVEFAIALLTPDDEGKAISDHAYHPRARQNTLVEIGWFWGKLGLTRVLILVKDKVEIPSDLQGLEYHSFSTSPVECSEKIRAFYKAHNLSVA